MKRVFVYLLIITAVIFGAFMAYSGFTPHHSNAGPEMPNIIFILGDDIGYSDIGPYGSEIKATQLSPPGSNINKFRGHPKGNEERRVNIPIYRPWEQLDEVEKDRLDLEMAVYATMVDRMDQNIGRLLTYLDEKEQAALNEASK